MNVHIHVCLFIYLYLLLFTYAFIYLFNHVFNTNYIYRKKCKLGYQVSFMLLDISTTFYKIVRMIDENGD